ncbi:hypothetical protein H0H10_32110 [Streptomyces sp. TRM S81-3]|uniref:Bacterial Ig-like domain-containing protein n=1 Tax=Streptomyces griseicoloratus TaxID=2752516 RepID=A0A926L992_9ACTN|nr:hypothetical protein [Streptomyces griseicoloratus]MBD0423749.1 hypothetical protein [Streptomyces griseicoloratus]
MSKKPSSGRKLFNGIEASGAFPVEYRFSHAKSGNRHLVVVFANFSAPEDYGWSNGVFDNVRANILWIRDRFDGMNAYYLCRNMDFGLADSVQTLISNVMRSLRLTPDQVTLWGGSKGGSAALYFGLRYGYRNIVAIVPQFLIGDALEKRHPKVSAYMLGEGAPAHNARVLDALLPDLVRAQANPGANIYVLSSPQDEHYSVQVEPFLGMFQGYENFNFMYSESPTITGHATVTRRNVPALVGLLNLLADGYAPRLGFVRHAAEEFDRDQSDIDAYLSATSKVQNADAFAPPVVTAPGYNSEVPVTGPRFAGTAPGAVRVSMWENGKFVASPEVAADGTWFWEPVKPWATGKHLVKIFAVDPAGFHSARVEVPFTVVEGAPGPVAHTPVAPAAAAGTLLHPPVVSVPGPQQQVGTSVGFHGTAPGAVEVRFRENGVLLGAAAVAPDGIWGWDAGWPWPEGPHLVEVVAVDPGGMESPPAPAGFTVLNAPAPAGYYTPRY